MWTEKKETAEKEASKKKLDYYGVRTRAISARASDEAVAATSGSFSGGFGRWNGHQHPLKPHTSTSDFGSEAKVTVLTSPTTEHNGQRKNFLLNWSSRKKAM